jgi:hypothetical protein
MQSALRAVSLVPTELASALVATAVLALLLGLWHGLPWIARWRRNGAQLQLRTQSR